MSRALFLGGLNVQDSPLYGAERRGAPVVAFTRFSEGLIHERGYVEKPDVAVLMDSSLLNYPEAAVLGGLDDASLLLVNTIHTEQYLRERYQTPARVVALDITSIALDLLGRQLLSAPMAGFTAKVAGVVSWSQVAEAVELELGAAGLAPGLVARNLRATQTAYDAAPSIGPLGPRPATTAVPRRLFAVPRLPARLAAPMIEAEATSSLRTTEGWRVYRPIVERSRCTRCFVCFALCPEGVIQLDPQNYPVIDYAHCKGCLVCMTECPPNAINELREDAA